MSPIRIPVHRPLVGPAELQGVQEVFDSRWLGAGGITKKFEEALAQLLDVRHVIAVNTGTAALHVALAALRLQPGDEVVLPSLTFVSSAQAILAVGGKPIFCEVSSDSLTMDVEDAVKRIGPRTKAIMPVDYGGRVCDMERLRASVGNKITLIEDAAHAFGSRRYGRMAGTLGDIGCFSFDPIKNITCGGGGAAVTEDDRAAAAMRTVSNVGIERDSWSRLHTERPWYYDVVAPGFRYQMSDLHAAIGMAQLSRLEEFRARKRCIVRSYDAAFQDLSNVVLTGRDEEAVFPFSYVVRVLDGRRDRLMRYLGERGIGTAVQFIPCHRYTLFANQTNLPVTDGLYDQIVTLPLYVEMRDQDVDEVIAGVHSFFGHRT